MRRADPEATVEGVPILVVRPEDEEQLVDALAELLLTVLENRRGRAE